MAKSIIYCTIVPKSNELPDSSGFVGSGAPSENPVVGRTMSNTIVSNFMEQKAESDLPRELVPDVPETLVESVPPVPTPVDDVGAGYSETEATWYSLDIRHVRLERVVGTIFWFVIVIAGLVGFGIWFFAAGLDWIWWLSFGSAAVAAGLLLWSTLAWPAVAHRNASWRLDETGLEIRRGVFWKHQISVPLARLQHADISQGPIQRRFGLAKLTVHTAGSANASVELDGLAIETATWLRDMLIRQKEAQDVV